VRNITYRPSDRSARLVRLGHQRHNLQRPVIPIRICSNHEPPSLYIIVVDFSGGIYVQLYVYITTLVHVRIHTYTYDMIRYNIIIGHDAHNITSLSYTSRLWFILYIIVCVALLYYTAAQSHSVSPAMANAVDVLLYTHICLYILISTYRVYTSTVLRVSRIAHDMRTTRIIILCNNVRWRCRRLAGLLTVVVPNKKNKGRTRRRLLRNLDAEITDVPAMCGPRGLVSRSEPTCDSSSSPSLYNIILSAAPVPRNDDALSPPICPVFGGSVCSADAVDTFLRVSAMCVCVCFFTKTSQDIIVWVLQLFHVRWVTYSLYRICMLLQRLRSVRDIEHFVLFTKVFVLITM